jgi:uncharacterized protein (DUF433 family)
MEAMDRIEVNPAICSGKPVIRGTRIMVRNILGMVAGEPESPALEFGHFTQVWVFGGAGGFAGRFRLPGRD